MQPSADSKKAIGFLVGGILFSLPSLRANYFVCRHFAENNSPTEFAKGYIMLAGGGFVTATFGVGTLIWAVADVPLLLVAVVIYTVSAGIGADVFRLRTKEERGNTDSLSQKT